MFKREARAIIVVAIFACSLEPSILIAEKNNVTDESPSKLAQQVYGSLLDNYRGGETGLGQLELLNNWSVRIVVADLSATALDDGLATAEIAQQSMQSHFARMRTLEQIVEKKVDAGLVRKSDLLAARYFRLEGNGIEKRIKAMRQLLQPVEVEGDLDIKMPSVDTAKPLTEKPPSLVIVINEKGKLFVEGKELMIEQLNKQVQKAVKANPGSATVGIRAHPECLFADVVRVLEACGKEGISISFTTVDDKSDEN